MSYSFDNINGWELFNMPFSAPARTATAPSKQQTGQPQQQPEATQHNTTPTAARRNSSSAQPAPQPAHQVAAQQKTSTVKQSNPALSTPASDKQSTPKAPTPAPVQATPTKQKPAASPKTLVNTQPATPQKELMLDMSSGSGAAPIDDAARRKAHEEAEAKRKAECEAKQATKKQAEEAALQKLNTMSDADIIAAAAKRVSTDTERLTRRNMKECVAEHIQELCKADTAFARKAMHPRKTMIKCFKYINRMARDYVKQEMEDNDIKPDGNFQPCYTVFQTKDDYITLSRREDGSTTWRKSAFDNLDGSYRFSDVCAFYSAKDESSVSRYFNCTDTGFEPLIKAQDAILARRRKQRQIAKEKAIISHMEGIPALPRGLKSWIKSIMPAYFFYDYKRGNKNVHGICSACGHEITLSGVKQGNKAICPNCKHSLIAKPRSRRGHSKYDRDTFEIIQNMGDGRLVIRIIKAYFSYTTDTPSIEIYENIRQFIYQDADGKFCTDHYYYAHNSGITTNWRKGIRPEYIMYQHQFEAGTCGYLFTENLPDALINTPWQYCTIADFYHHFRERMQVLPFLREYLKHPRLEHLCKVGFYDIASDLVYKGDTRTLDETQNRTHKILGVAAEDIPFLRDMGADMSILKTFQKYDGIKDRQRLLVWQLKHDVKHNILPILKHITVHKLIRYTEKQFPLLCRHKDKYGNFRYQKMQDIVTEYRDYLEICVELDYNMKNSFILYPKNLQQAHDRVQKRYKIKENELLLKNFKAAVQDAREHYAFEANGMKIIVPNTPGDLAAEGNALHHCVGGYTGRMAKKECIILFLRQCTDDTQPFFTIEVRGHEIIQVHGIGNCAATPEVKRFINTFKQQVLQGSVNRAA